MINICIFLLRVHFKKRSAKDPSSDAYAIFFLYFCSLNGYIKAYVAGTHLNCIDKSDGYPQHMPL